LNHALRLFSEASKKIVRPKDGSAKVLARDTLVTSSNIVVTSVNILVASVGICHHIGWTPPDLSHACGLHRPKGLYIIALGD